MAAVASVSCIIPAYNEGKRIGGVLSAIVGHPLVGEVIVVDDASTDETAEIVKATQGVRLISLERNRGKSGALNAGIRETTGPLLLWGWRSGRPRCGAHHRAHSAGPRRPRRYFNEPSGECSEIWKRDRTRLHLRRTGFPETPVGRSAYALQRLPKFGFEVHLNDLCIEKKYRIAIVPWEGVRSPLKSAKYGLGKGVLPADIGMIADIGRSAVPFICCAKSLRCAACGSTLLRGAAGKKDGFIPAERRVMLHRSPPSPDRRSARDAGLQGLASSIAPCFPANAMCWLRQT